MSEQVQSAIAAALLARLNHLLAEASLEASAGDAGLSRPPRRELGDLSTNLAMRFAKKLGMKPLELANRLAASLGDLPQVRSCEVAPPGFLNVYLAGGLQAEILRRILAQGDAFGRGEARATRVLVEYVSSNPTGPLHIGHGRGAAYGATLVNLLRFSGLTVDAEYYVNDAGRQMAILALSVWLRGQPGEGFDAYPERCYQGDYVSRLARDFELAPWRGAEEAASVTRDLSADPEEAVDECLRRVRAGVGGDAFDAMQQRIGDAMVALIRSQLEGFRVHMDNWFSEASLVADGQVEACLETLRARGHIYVGDGAEWFASSNFGDEKDRVVKRANGSHTYFATDIAYHRHKCRRGYDKLINIFGADHHGYLERLKAALAALGENAGRLDFIINQFAVLWRGGEKLALSTRAGVFVELDRLFGMIGVDEARFMYLTQRHDQHLEFDLELAASQSRDNPVYYVNYAYARAGQICLQAEKAGLAFDQPAALGQLDALTHERELALIDKLGDFPALIQRAAAQYTPHSLTVYARELAGLFHNYYASVRVIDPTGPAQARLALCVALRQVIRNCLALLNIAPPEQM